MSHAIYQTPAIILKTKNMRESNKLIILYTERFGLIYASTQSIRELKSKMRFHTNTLSLVTVDLVRGRDIWKITGIHEEHSSLQFAGTSWYELADTVSGVLLRLCNGEEAHEKLWQDIRALYALIKKHQEGTSESHDVIEIIMLGRTLYHLGYWEGEEQSIHSTVPFNPENYQEVVGNKKIFVQKINQGINRSQL